MRAQVAGGREDLKALDNRLNELKIGQPNRPQIDAAVREREGALRTLRGKVTELREQADSVADAYKALEKDPVAKAALADVAKKFPAVKFGPSDRFRSAVGELVRFEKSLGLQGASSAPKSKRR